MTTPMASPIHGPVALRGGEPVSIPTADGAQLAGELLLPDGPPPRVVAALSHAMMVDRRTLDLTSRSSTWAGPGPGPGPGTAPPARGGILTELLQAGVAVLWFDQRGHGQSGPTAAQGGRWDYDDLVDDAGAVAAYLDARLPGLLRVAIGHSLFGHVALAYQAHAHAAGKPMRYDGFVLIASNVWLRALEPRPLRWLRKRLSYGALLQLARPLGYLPVRRLRLGTADEPYAYLAQMGEWVRSNDWTDRSGGSYLAGLPAITAPILSIAGAGDRLMAVPACQQALVGRTSGPISHWVLGRAHGDELDPDHMGLVLDARLRPRWRALSAWVAGLPARVPPRAA